MPYSDERLKKVLEILNSQTDYRYLKQDLDNYFQDSSWADAESAASAGSFARVFTSAEEGWLTAEEIAVFWDCVDTAPGAAAIQSLNSGNELYEFLLNKINYWKSPPAAEAEAASYETETTGYTDATDGTDVDGENYRGWKQRWDSGEGVWKYSNGGPWVESHIAFPPVATASRIFRIGYPDGTERTFLADGHGEREVWPWNPTADPNPAPLTPTTTASKDTTRWAPSS